MARKNNKRLNDLVDPADGAATWKERFAIARTNQDRMFKRFSDWYDALYAQIGRVPSPWRSKVYAPVLAKQTWNLLAKFLTVKPGFQIEVRDEGLDNEAIEEKAEKMQKALEFDYDNAYFEESMRDKLYSPLLDAIVTGTGMAKVPWTVCKETHYERMKDAYDTIDLTKYKEKEITQGYNDLIPVNIFGVFVSPATKTLYNAPWIIIREYKPIAELEAVNDAEGVTVYHNLDQLNGKVSYDTYAAYDRARNRLLANADPTDKTVRMVALYECYEKSSNMIYTYAESGAAAGDTQEGWILLRKQENPYWHGKYPLVKFHLKKKAYNFWGEGIYEINYRLQAAYNDIVNHYIDAMNVAFDPMLIAPEDANVNDYVVQPAGLVQYSGNTAPQPFKHIAPTPEQLETPLSLFDSLIEGTTIPQYATGIANDETDKTKGTASGIRQLQQAAGDVVTFFRQNLGQSILQVGKMWMSNRQQFMIRPLTVTVNRPEGATPMEIKPQDLQGDMDLSIDESSMEPLTQEDKIAQYKAYIQDLIALQNQSFMQNKIAGTDPLSVDFNKLAEDLSENYQMLDFNKILFNQQQLQQIQQQHMAAAAQHVAAIQQQQAMMGAQQQQQQGPSTPPKSLAEQLKITFDKLPEDAQQQLIFQIFGIHSQMPTPTEKQLMLQGVDTVTKAAQAGHGMQMDRLGLAHDVAQAQQQQANQQQQMDQAAQQQQFDQDQAVQQAEQQAAQPQVTQGGNTNATHRRGTRAKSAA